MVGILLFFVRFYLLLAPIVRHAGERLAFMCSARSRRFGFSVVVASWGRRHGQSPRGCVSSWRLAGAFARRAGLLACSGSWSFSVKGRGPRAWLSRIGLAKPLSVAGLPPGGAAYASVTRRHSP